MFSYFSDWKLQRSPLAPSVPLEGSDTVQGLRTLERLQAASLLANNGRDGAGSSGNNAQGRAAVSSRRRRYQRYKGPFIDQLTLDDLRKDPRPWKQFSGFGDGGPGVGGYSIPASLDILCERMEENGAVFATNYLRVMLVIVMLTLYLRPVAVIGAAALAITIAYNLNKALQQQAAAQTNTNNAAGGGGQPPMQQTSTSAVLTLVSWVAVVYTRCVPVILLGLLLATFLVVCHAALRQGPSESRHRGRTPLGYTFLQFLGRQPVPGAAADCNPRLVLSQLWREGLVFVKRKARVVRQWGVYYLLAAWDGVRRPFVPALRSAPLATAWS